MIFDLFTSSTAPKVFREVALFSDFISAASDKISSPPSSIVIVDVEVNVTEELIVSFPPEVIWTF